MADSDLSELALDKLDDALSEAETLASDAEGWLSGEVTREELIARVLNLKDALDAFLATQEYEVKEDGKDSNSQKDA